MSDPFHEYEDRLLCEEHAAHPERFHKYENTMSTDTTEAPILQPAGPTQYLVIHHPNSNRSQYRGLFRTTTYQVVRHPEGGPLPKGYSREVLRSFSSKYKPHVGKKQLAKLA